MTSFATYKKTRCLRVEKALESILPASEEEPQRLHQAMRYAVLDGGKRLRPLLVYAVGEALGAKLNVLDIPAAAVELIHAYSLVHDDLPAMDDDDVRRGKPSCHRAFDEATAILVGDALQSLAFEILVSPSEIHPTLQLQMVQILAEASGSLGMAGGQCMDLQATDASLDLPQLETLYRRKTGALIQASVQLGAWSVVGIAGSIRDALDIFAECLGLGFQIRDDIHDIEGDVLTLGKITYPKLVGMQQAKIHLHDLYQRAIDALSPLGDRSDCLAQLAEHMLCTNNEPDIQITKHYSSTS